MRSPITESQKRLCNVNGCFSHVGVQMQGNVYVHPREINWKVAFDSNRVLHSFAGSRNKSGKIAAAFSPCWHPLGTATRGGVTTVAPLTCIPEPPLSRVTSYSCSIHCFMLSPHSAALHQSSFCGRLNFVFFLMCGLSVSSGSLENLKFKMLCLLLLYYYAN